MVDSLYKALTPASKWKKEFDFIAPSTLKQAVTDGEIQAATAKELMEGLRSNFDVAMVILLTVHQRRDLFDVTAEMKDLSTGKIVGTETRNDLKGDELSKGVRNSVAKLFAQTEH